MSSYEILKFCYAESWGEGLRESVFAQSLSTVTRKDKSHERRQPEPYYCRPPPDDTRLVWILQTCRPQDIFHAGWIHPATIAGDIAQARKATRVGEMLCRSETLAKCVLRKVRAIHHDKRLNGSEPMPMRKLQTGEPCAGEPHARFGGRGRRELFSTTITSTLDRTPNW